MITVLITGCAGYIGSMLTNTLLCSGYKVIGIDSLMYNNTSAISGFLGNKNFRFYKLDISSKAWHSLLDEASVVFHLAALVGAPVCKKNEDLTTAINQTATEYLVDALKDNQRLIFPNTNSGYGIGGEDFCTEESPLNPISSYGITKCNAEKAVLRYKNSVSLRLATVFGSSFRPRFDLLVNDWTAQICLFRNLEIYESHFRRNFIHIQDVVRCMMFMIDPKYQGVYNLGLDSANMTKMELAQRICNNLNMSYDVIKEGEGEDKDKRNYIVSSARLKKTGFGLKYTIDDGIKEIAQLCALHGHKVLKMGNVSNDYS